MEKLSTGKYQTKLVDAVRYFWMTKDKQLKNQKKTDHGARGSVTGGKQLDGFINLFVQVAKDIGIPETSIYTRGNDLPGFFRPTKEWDFLIISPKKQLVTVIEFKSQVGSFGNNFNNRSEEALGSAVDFWTALRENGFSQVHQPWLGYLMLVEKSEKSTSPVRLKEPHFKVREEFQETSYIDRYSLLCKKLMKERHYTSTAMIWTNNKMEHGCIDEEISFESFLLSFMGFLQGKLNEFDK